MCKMRVSSTKWEKSSLWKTEMSQVFLGTGSFECQTLCWKFPWAQISRVPSWKSKSAICGENFWQCRYGRSTHHFVRKWYPYFGPRQRTSIYSLINRKFLRRLGRHHSQVSSVFAVYNCWYTLVIPVGLASKGLASRYNLNWILVGMTFKTQQKFINSIKQIYICTLYVRFYPNKNYPQANLVNRNKMKFGWKFT